MTIREIIKEAFINEKIDSVFTRKEILEKVNKTLEQTDQSESNEEAEDEYEDEEAEDELLGESTSKELKIKKGKGKVNINPDKYCYNRTSNGMNFFKTLYKEPHLFEYLDDDKYKYLGENSNYTGQVFKGKSKNVVGAWQEGEFTLAKELQDELEEKNKEDKEKLLKTINCVSILDYLDVYAGKAYSDPENASDKEKVELEKIKDAGSAAVEELDKMARLCEIEFKLERVVKSKWLSGSNTEVRNYLWQQMKYPNCMGSPTSISLFAEIVEQEARFRFSIEFNDSQKKDKEQELEKHHKILDLPIKQGSGLVYILGGINTKIRQLDEDREKIKEEVKKGNYEKIQISFIITRKEIEENKLKDIDILNVMSKGIKELLPFYKLVVEEHGNNTNLATIPSMEDKPVVNNEIKLNTILYGPPGTGKTYNAVNYAVAIIESQQNKTLKDVTEEDYNEVYQRYLKYKEEGRIVFTTFHQSYGYEEFIEGIKPELNKQGNDISYILADGIFKQFCNQVIEKNKDNKVPHVFIIDEINRGNISKIFGELITLIEESKRLGGSEPMTAKLPYSPEKEFGVPDNVYLLGTMNTADRSIALMDTALRRRFNFVEMMPDTRVLEKISEIEGINIAKMLAAINERIEILFDREHTIGHSYFTCLLKKPMDGQKSRATVYDLADIFKNSIIPLLQEYFYEDYSKIQLVLGDNAKEDEYKFILDNKVDRNIFKAKDNKSNSLDVDLPEKKYVIQYAAFNEVESYKQIY